LSSIITSIITSTRKVNIIHCFIYYSFLSIFILFYFSFSDRVDSFCDMCWNKKTKSVIKKAWCCCINVLFVSMSVSISLSVSMLWMKVLCVIIVHHHHCHHHHHLHPAISLSLSYLFIPVSNKRLLSLFRRDAMRCDVKVDRDIIIGPVPIHLHPSSFCCRCQQQINSHPNHHYRQLQSYGSCVCS